MQRVFLTGATGFVGRHVLDELLKKGYTVRVLVRPGSERKLPHSKHIEHAFGDLSDPLSVEEGMKGCGSVINLVGIIRESPKEGITYRALHIDATRTLLAGAKKHKIRRFVQISALGVRISAKTSYFQTKYEAEQLVIRSGLTYTILRPSMIFGPGDVSINTISSFIRKTGMFVIFGNGMYRIQPVYVGDVAKAVAHSLHTQSMYNNLYEMGGPKTYTFRRFVDTVSDLVLHRVVVFHIPLFLGRPLVSLLQHIPGFPMTRDALEMLVDESITADSSVYRDAKIRATEFESKAVEWMRH